MTHYRHSAPGGEALALACYVEVEYQAFVAYQRANGWRVYSRKRYAKWARWI
jgi:hypothetical protein